MNRSLRGTAIAASAVVALSGLAACGSAGDKSSAASTNPKASSPKSTGTASSGGTTSAQSAMIMIHDFAFKGPGSVAAGAEVTVMNMDSEAHTVTADGAGAFDVKVDPGKSATFRAPTAAGDYAFHCTFHSNMHGSLTVG